MTQSRTSNAHDKMRDADATYGMGRLAANSHLNPDILLAIYEGALSADRDACKSAITQAAKLGISNIDLADLYIPVIARHLGELWCEDHLGFASVTIGSARLQTLLRDLGPEWNSDGTALADAPSILLVTPRNAVHTLGAVVLAGQLRRRGYSVRLAYDADRQAIADVMDRIAFDAVFISAAQSENLEKLRRVVEFMRTLSHRHVPIVIGGSVTDLSDKLASMTGADHVTSDIEKAITLCNLQRIPAKATIGSSR